MFSSCHANCSPQHASATTREHHTRRMANLLPTCSAPRDVKLLYHGQKCGARRDFNLGGNLLMGASKTISHSHITQMRGIKAFIKPRQHPPCTRFTIVFRRESRRFWSAVMPISHGNIALKARPGTSYDREGRSLFCLPPGRTKEIRTCSPKLMDGRWGESTLGRGITDYCGVLYETRPGKSTWMAIRHRVPYHNLPYHTTYTEPSHHQTKSNQNHTNTPRHIYRVLSYREKAITYG